MTHPKSNKTSFKPGQSGNPAGRKPGTGALQKLRADLQDFMPEMIEQLKEMARGGDIQAMRLLLERGYAPIKATEQPVELELPEGGTLTAKAEAVLSAAAAGKLAPTQAAQLITALGTVAKIAEFDELEARIAKLEESNAKP
ncbi:DUF5681 domain-containing protein [Rhodoferax sp. GW822-FHT02A01]|uniref:DUF5681 domain-containing protein n=1 Tax=Rhodoferax sp. GW822-FHT02A01 TaxID=3141537 RepID=UPI00315D2FDF